MADDGSAGGASTSARQWVNAKNRLKAIFADIARELGEETAVRLWQSVSSDVLINTSPRGRGRPEATRLEGWDMLLLHEYDNMSEPDPSRKVRRLAESMHGQVDRYRSATVEALEKRIRRLLELREAGRLVREEMVWGYKYTDILPPDGH
jgi:plasmid stabilization system protein ParE